jgi:hypothetical protein
LKGSHERCSSIISALLVAIPLYYWKVRQVEVVEDINNLKPASSHMAAISAKCAASLRRNLQSMLDYIKWNA